MLFACGYACVSGEVLGNERERLKFYGHALYIN